MHMYKNMRDELLREESKTKSDNQKHKIEELNVKMAQMDIAKKDKEDKSRRQEQEEQQRRDANEAKKNAGTKSLLDNIKSFSVEDI